MNPVLLGGALHWVLGWKAFPEGGRPVQP